MTKTLKVLGIINLVVVAITFIAIFGGAEATSVGFWAIVALGLSVAQSIVGIVKYNKNK